MYLYQRGSGAKRRVMHLAAYNRRGECVGALCGEKRVDLNTSCDVPLGLRTCKTCLKEYQRAE